MLPHSLIINTLVIKKVTILEDLGLLMKVQKQEKNHLLEIKKNKDLGLLKKVRKQERLSLKQGMNIDFSASFYIPKSYIGTSVKIIKGK